MATKTNPEFNWHLVFLSGWHVAGLVLIMALIAGLAGCKRGTDSEGPQGGASKSNSGQVDIESLDEEDAMIVRANRSEDLVLELSPKLNVLARHLRGEPSQVSEVVSDSIQYIGPGDATLPIPASDVQKFKWPIDPTEKSISCDQLLSQVLKEATLLDGKFGVLEGKFDGNDTFLMTTKLEGKLQLQTGEGGLKSKQEIAWKRLSTGQWKVSKWRQKWIEITHIAKPLFSNVTAQAIPDAELLSNLQASKHESHLLRRAKDSLAMDRFGPVFAYFTDWTSLFQYPSASIVDIDRDGWDDVYISDRFGASVLLRNRGDGTFEDVSESCGLRLSQSLTNCTLFADFDNDGDSDCLMGRTQQQSLFYRNENGKFVLDQETNKELAMVRFVSSMSVVDVNSDGLLDVYFSTYATRSGEDMAWVQYAVPPSLQNQLVALIGGSHPFVDRRGPPNILLINKNGSLRSLKTYEPLHQWRNSFQSVWSDIDDDGDQDCYICNDFAPDVFLENATEPGSTTIQFYEITDRVFEGNSMGFGMGASFGDYNSDGKLDLYISNMYSKAGHRVIGKFKNEVDPRISISTKGNFLYENVDVGRFRHVAGNEPGQQPVGEVGWSFGGQFVDVTNDGKLDLYVPSGFFTAPDEIAAEVDL